MSGPASKSRAFVATVVALSLGWGLWLLSETLEESVSAGVLFPVFRLAVIFLGLSLGERAFIFANAYWFRNK